MDYNLFLLINNLAGKWMWLDSLAIFFAQYFIYYSVAAAAVVFLLIKDKKEKIRYLILSGASIILSRAIITELIRLIWHRPRPFLVHQIIPLINHSSSGSFPSGHITFLFALATVIYLFNKNFGIAFFIFSFLIGIARVFVGVHWPLDILAGMVIGVLSTIIVKFFIRR